MDLIILRIYSKKYLMFLEQDLVAKYASKTQPLRIYISQINAYLENK